MDQSDQTPLIQPTPILPPSPDEILPKQTKVSLFLPIFLTFLITSTLFIGGYFGYQYLTKPQLSVAVPQTPPPSPIPQTTISDPTTDWKTYKNSIYQFKYPVDIQLKESDGSRVTLTKAGPTQKIGTELYDGISLNFDPRELSMTPQQYALNIIANSKENFDSKIIKEPVSTKINQYVGVDFILENMGKTHYYVIQSDNNILLTVADGTIDPTSQGYFDIVSQILSTLKFITNNSDFEDKHIGYIKSITPTNQGYSLTIDYVQLLNEDNLEATKACIEAGKCLDCSPNLPCTPNGFFIKNTNPQLRTIPIDPNPTVIMQTYSHIDGGDFNFNQTIPFSQFVQIFSNSQPNSTLAQSLYWITIKDGRIIRIEEQYLP